MPTARDLIRIPDDATPEQIHAGIRALRAKQRAAVIPSTADEYGAAIDELLDRLAR